MGRGRRRRFLVFAWLVKPGLHKKSIREPAPIPSTQFVGSFVGYVPAESPRLAMIVVIDEPQGEAWGGAVAAPVFRRVGEQVLNYLGVSREDTVKIAWR